MCKDKIKEIADDANMIVSGYAFKRQNNGFISFLTLNILIGLWL